MTDPLPLVGPVLVELIGRDGLADLALDLRVRLLTRAHHNGMPAPDVAALLELERDLRRDPQTAAADTAAAVWTSLPAVQQQTGVPRSTLHRWAVTGRVPARKLRGRWVVDAAAVQRLTGHRPRA